MLQKQFQNDIKYTITEYANNAREELNKNRKIKEHLSRIKYINNLYKKLITDIMQKKVNKEEIRTLLIKFNSIFADDNGTIKYEINEEQKKFIKYQRMLRNELEPLKEILNHEKNINFIYKNRLICQKNTISRYSFFLVIPGMNKYIESYIVEEDFDSFLTEIYKTYQDTLINSLKSLNAIKAKNQLKQLNIDKMKKILSINNNKEEIINYEIKEKNDKIIKENNRDNSIASFQEFDLMPSFSILDNIEENDINIVKDIFNLPQKNLLNSNINLKSFNKAIIKKETNNANKKNMKTFSLDLKLNLTQIQFNKDNNKYKFSSDFRRRGLLSKSLNNTNDKKSEDKKLTERTLKKNIKKLNKNITKNKSLIKEFKKYYNSIINKYYKFIYQPNIDSYVLSSENCFNDES
jgi:hypothetical protein